MTSAPRWSYQLPTCLSSKLSSSVLSSCIPFVTLTFLTIAQSLTADKLACTTPTSTATQIRILKELKFSQSMHSKFNFFGYFRPKVNKKNQRPYIHTGELPTCLYIYEINFAKHTKLKPHFLSLISFHSTVIWIEILDQVSWGLKVTLSSFV